MINDGAISLWTFDGDAYDPVSRKLVVPPGEPNIIIDEIEMRNPGYLVSDHDTYLGYRLGMDSLNQFEQTDEHSISFGYYGAIEAHPTLYPKSYVEIPHTVSYTFPGDAFTVEMIFKSSGAAQLGTSPPLIKKSGVISVELVFPGAQHIPSYMSVQFLNNPSITVSYSSSTVNHLVMTWELVQIEDSIFQGKARVYINSVIVASEDYEYLDSFPSPNGSSTWYIGGSPASGDYFSANCQIDQVAVYDRVLNDDEVTNHTSKMYEYGRMLVMHGADRVYAFNDLISTNTTDIRPYSGSLIGTYYGGNSRIVREVIGPGNILNSKAVDFNNGGCAAWKKLYTNPDYGLDPEDRSTYTYEWWFNTTDTRRAIMFAVQSFYYPYYGPCVQLNMRDNNLYLGSIQFSESETGVVLNSRLLNDYGNYQNFNDRTMASYSHN